MKSRGSLRLVTIVMMGMCVFYGAMAFQMPVETKVVDQSTFLVLNVLAGIGLVGGIVNALLTSPMLPANPADDQSCPHGIGCSHGICPPHDGCSANIRFAILHRSRCSDWSPRSAPGTGKPRVRIRIAGTAYNLICVIGI